MHPLGWNLAGKMADLSKLPVDKIMDMLAEDSEEEKLPDDRK